MHPDTLGKTKVTGVEQVDTAQDSINNAVGSQVGQGGMLQPVGDAVSKGKLSEQLSHAVTDS